MLILSRKANESIIIGENIEVKIISIDKGVVKLGIEAPSSISIMRNELLKEVQASNKAASFHIDDAILENFYKSFSKKT